MTDIRARAEQWLADFGGAGTGDIPIIRGLLDALTDQDDDIEWGQTEADNWERAVAAEEALAKVEAERDRIAAELRRTKKERDEARAAIDVDQAGYAVVKLPEPSSDDGGDKVWLDGVVTCNPGHGKVRLYPEDHRLPAESARELAAALLAAAQVADGGAS